MRESMGRSEAKRSLEPSPQVRAHDNVASSRSQRELRCRATRGTAIISNRSDTYI